MTKISYLYPSAREMEDGEVADRIISMQQEKADTQVSDVKTDANQSDRERSCNR